MVKINRSDGKVKTWVNRQYVCGMAGEYLKAKERYEKSVKTMWNFAHRVIIHLIVKDKGIPHKFKTPIKWDVYNDTKKKMESVKFVSFYYDVDTYDKDIILKTSKRDWYYLGKENLNLLIEIMNRLVDQYNLKEE